MSWKWWVMISETRSNDAVKLTPRFLGTYALGDIQGSTWIDIVGSNLVYLVLWQDIAVFNEKIIRTRTVLWTVIWLSQDYYGALKKPKPQAEATWRKRCMTWSQLIPAKVPDMSEDQSWTYNPVQTLSNCASVPDIGRFCWMTGILNELKDQSSWNNIIFG